MTRPMRGWANFRQLHHEGLRGRSGPVTVSFVPGAEDHAAHVGYAVSRRIGTAVTRNRVRRRLRAAVRVLARADPPTLRGGKYLITPAPGTLTCSFDQLTTAVQVAVDRSRRAALGPGAA